MWLLCLCWWRHQMVISELMVGSVTHWQWLETTRYSQLHSRYFHQLSVFYKQIKHIYWGYKPPQQIKINFKDILSMRSPPQCIRLQGKGDATYGSSSNFWCCPLLCGSVFLWLWDDMNQFISEVQHSSAVMTTFYLYSLRLRSVMFIFLFNLISHWSIISV